MAYGFAWRWRPHQDDEDLDDENGEEGASVGAAAAVASSTPEHAHRHAPAASSAVAAPTVNTRERRPVDLQHPRSGWFAGSQLIKSGAPAAELEALFTRPPKGMLAMPSYQLREGEYRSEFVGYTLLHYVVHCANKADAGAHAISEEQADAYARALIRCGCDVRLSTPEVRRGSWGTAAQLDAKRRVQCLHAALTSVDAARRLASKKGLPRGWEARYEQGHRHYRIVDPDGTRYYTLGAAKEAAAGAADDAGPASGGGVDDSAVAAMHDDADADFDAAGDQAAVAIDDGGASASLALSAEAQPVGRGHFSRAGPIDARSSVDAARRLASEKGLPRGWEAYYEQGNRHYRIVDPDGTCYKTLGAAKEATDGSGEKRAAENRRGPLEAPPSKQRRLDSPGTHGAPRDLNSDSAEEDDEDDEADEVRRRAYAALVAGDNDHEAVIALNAKLLANGDTMGARSHRPGRR